MAGLEVGNWEESGEYDRLELVEEACRGGEVEVEGIGGELVD